MDTESDEEELKRVATGRTDTESDEESDGEELEITIAAGIDPKEAGKIRIHLQNAIDNPHLSRKTKRAELATGATRKKMGQECPFKKICGMWVTGGNCRHTKTERKEENARQKEEERKENQEIRETNRAFHREQKRKEEKVKRAANALKIRVFDELFGSVEEAQKAADAKKKLEAAPVPMEESDEEDSDEEESDEEESDGPVTEQLKQAIEFEKAIAEVHANAQEACEAACAEACEQIKADFQAEVAAEHMRLLADCS